MKQELIDTFLVLAILAGFSAGGVVLGAVALSSAFLGYAALLVAGITVGFLLSAWVVWSAERN